MPAFLLDSDTPPNMNMDHVDAIYDKVYAALLDAFKGEECLLHNMNAHRGSVKHQDGVIEGFSRALDVINELRESETYRSGDPLAGL